MNVIFLGATKFSLELIDFLVNNDIKIQAIYTTKENIVLPKSKTKINNVNHVDLYEYKYLKDTPIREVAEEKSLSAYKEEISNFNPDVIIAAGWYYMVPEAVRVIPKNGVWGIHASFLPKYAGWSPLVWALINGENDTGVTIFKMDNSIDGGDIVKQKKINIDFDDTIDTLYKKVTETTKSILKNLLSEESKINFTKQNQESLEVYPRRTESDGILDFNQNALQVYNFVRAQTRPYPGAFAYLDEKKLILWITKPSNKVFQDKELGEIVIENEIAYISLVESSIIVNEVEYENKTWNFNKLVMEKKLEGSLIYTSIKKMEE
ncbi:MAG: methionyl-tRNA formyltransferase [Arcobacter sp.]|uniref:methionyl-tRNA formyltransferase n=1 Tax=Arcobacter sp. TaxID=1872629 RepID=UPI003B00B12F